MYIYIHTYINMYEISIPPAKRWACLNGWNRSSRACIHKFIYHKYTSIFVTKDIPPASSSLQSTPLSSSSRYTQLNPHIPQGSDRQILRSDSDIPQGSDRNISPTSNSDGAEEENNDLSENWHDTFSPTPPDSPEIMECNLSPSIALFQVYIYICIYIYIYIYIRFYSKKKYTK
jgi:hypothetical protein